MEKTREDDHYSYTSNLDGEWSEDHRALKQAVDEVRDRALKAHKDNRVGILYRSHDDTHFHWTGIGTFPEDFIDMLETFLQTMIGIGESDGYDREEMREALKLMVEGKCPGCGETREAHDAKRH